MRGRKRRWWEVKEDDEEEKEGVKRRRRWRLKEEEEEEEKEEQVKEDKEEEEEAVKSFRIQTFKKLGKQKLSLAASTSLNRQTRELTRCAAAAPAVLQHFQ